MTTTRPIRGVSGGKARLQHVAAAAALLGALVAPLAAAGPRLVKVINAKSSDPPPPEFLAVVGNRLFFTADDGEHGWELWVSDGTEAGTFLVRDVPGSDTEFWHIWYATAVGDRLYFMVSDGEVGDLWDLALWVSDGTEAGTILLRDGLHALAPPRSSFGAVAVGDRLFFSVHNGQLWVSDGTEAGTAPVGVSILRSLTAVGDRLFFVGEDSDHGPELWTSDGTQAGTALVKDIHPGSEGSGPWAQIAVGDRLFFVADDGEHGFELWRSDGTEAGTSLVKDIHPGGDAFLSALLAVGDRLFFVGDDGEHGQELWVSDGSETGTVLVRDIHPGTASPSLGSMIAVGDRLFFDAVDDFAGLTLWVSDGTEAGTVLLRAFGGERPSRVASAAALDRLFYFSGLGELWTSDGTPGGTVVLAEDATPDRDSFPHVDGHLTRAGDGLFFGAGGELWILPLNGPRPSFHRGDPNADGTTDLSDAIAIFGFLFLGDDAPTCQESADSNHDGKVDISDGIHVLSWLFAGGPPPAPPGPPPAPCGQDVDSPDLGCETYPGC